MGIVSYAQNFEDVILWRALGHLPHGCYIDVGAQHPIVDSISKAFYEHGWRGIHVEPTTEHANLLRADRPDETIVQAVVTDYPGVIRFYEIPGTGLSTARRDIAEEHQKKFGYPVVETLVTAVTLDDLLALAPGDDIHWLKIDVEGFEREVLSGWQKSARRPWIVVVEATYPTTQVDTFEQWEPLVLEKGYALVYQDGLNRYYLNDRRTELQPHFHFPPNVFDAFQLSGTASSLTRQLKDRLDHELAQMSAQKADVESQLHATRTALQSLEISADGHERALTSLAERTLLEAQDKAQAYLLHLLERERAFAERQDALQREAGAREEQLRQGHLAQTDGLRAEQRAREAALQHDFEARLTELRQAAQAEQARLEQALDALRGQHADAQAKAEARLQELLERERAFAERQDALQREAGAREEQLRQGHLAQTDGLRAEQRAREAALQHDFEARLTELRQAAQAEQARLEQALDALCGQHADAQAKAEARFQELLDRERAFAERQDALQREAGAREEQLRQGHLAQTDGLRAEQRAREAALQHDFEARLTELRRAAQAELAQLEQLVDALRGQMAIADTIRKRLEAELVQNLDTARRLSVEIDSMRLSWSWRLTQPLRWFARRERHALSAPHTTALESPLPSATAPITDQTVSPPQVRPAPSTSREPENPPLNLTTHHTHEQSPEEIIVTLDEILSLPGEGFVRAAYRAILEREADEAGLRHYLKRLAHGYGKASVLYDLAQSSEAKTRTSHEDLAPLSDDAFLDTIYQRLLRRQADSNGKSHYLNALKKHGDRRRIIRDIENSAEAHRRNGKALDFKQDLAELLREEKLARSWLGWWKSWERIERRLGMLEERIDDSCRLSNHLLSSLSALDNQVRDLAPLPEMVRNALLTAATLPSSRSTLITHPSPADTGELLEHRSSHPIDNDVSKGESELSLLLENPSAQTIRQRILNPSLGVLYYYVDHTVKCPVNTGMQRVTRQLARSLLVHGKRVVFVKWLPGLNRMALINQLELVHLAEWGGPKLSEEEIAATGYPLNDECEPVVIEGSNIHDRNWLIVPEVTHINYHGRQLTLDIILAAKRACLHTAFVFYDAIPLRREELAGMATLHEAYMRQLLQADVILPISAWSAQELHNFFRHHELVDENFIPAIEPLLLPAEVHGEERVTSDGQGGIVNVRKILCVGSIDERKNQLALVRAFVGLAHAGRAEGWQLGLIGNCNPALHEELKTLMDSCRSVVWFGNSSDGELKQAYADSAFTVFPSIEEGFGLPIAESLWYGKPCLCANFGPMAEIAEGGGCLQINMRDQEAISKGLLSMMHDELMHNKLVQQAKKRNLVSWSDYGQHFLHSLATKSNAINSLQSVYYLVDHTASYPHNTGIQRVVRALAAALQRLGVRLIAAKWNETKTALVPPGPEELDHLAKWNGPLVNGWGGWREPGESTGDWVIFPELTPHYLPAEYVAMRNFLDAKSMRGGWVFYDTIPWKLRDIYPVEATQGHRHYMAGLNLFELILPISHYSREQLETFYLGEPLATVDLSHRLVACPLPAEFQETPRIFTIKDNHDQPIHILSVGTLEPRKNHLTLVHAFLHAAANSPRPMRLTLVGGGPVPAIADQVKTLIAENSNIQWVRDSSDTELNQLYAECDFTVYPSYEEGFGLPILESLWHARPCICMNAGAMAEVAAGGGCLLVDTTREADLAAAILRMTNDCSQRQLLAAEATQRPFRTWDDYASDFALHLAEERRVPQQNAERMQRAPLATVSDVYGAMCNITERPLLSVCISTYNRAKWLSLSLAVLVREVAGLGGQVEVFVCDNTSTDNTPEIVAPYVVQGLVRYHRNPENVGMLGNLRVTAQEARGKYIWILGDDDLLKPNAVRRVINIIEANPDLAMVYLNYAYTREESPEQITHLDQFFANATSVADGGNDYHGRVKEVAVMNENFFTAIYCVVFQRSHALLAYSQFTEGEPFSSLPTCVPTTNHVLHAMMDLPAYWVADPQVVINLNVSWLRFAWRWILERFPEIHDVAVRYGAESFKVDKWRENHLPSIEHYLKEIFTQLEITTVRGFNFTQLIARIKHTAGYKIHRSALMALYSEAFNNGHPLARRTPNSIFLEN